jgi:hypothetical protein
MVQKASEVLEVDDLDIFVKYEWKSNSRQFLYVVAKAEIFLIIFYLICALSLYLIVIS